MPWTTTRAFFVKRTAKSGASRRQLDRKFRGLLDGLRGLAADGPENLLRRGFVYAFNACDDRDGRMHLVESLFHAHRDRVRLRDPAENIHEDHGRVRLDEELEGLFDLLRIVGASKVEEYAASSAFQIQRIEGRHRQARAIRDDPDGAVHLDEHDTLVMGLLLQGRPVLVQACVFGMPVFRVVVDHELRIPRDDASLFRHHEGVDLDELGVLFPEEIVGTADDRGDLFTDVLVQGEAPQEGPDHVRLEADHGGDVLHEEVLSWDLPSDDDGLL